MMGYVRLTRSWTRCINMCELILFFGGAVIVSLLWWVIRLDDQLEDYKRGIKQTKEEPSDEV